MDHPITEYTVFYMIPGPKVSSVDRITVHSRGPDRATEIVQEMYPTCTVLDVDAVGERHEIF